MNMMETNTLNGILTILDGVIQDFEWLLMFVTRRQLWHKSAWVCCPSRVFSALSQANFFIGLLRSDESLTKS